MESHGNDLDTRMDNCMKYSKGMAALLGVSLLAGQFFLPSVQASQIPADEHLQVETAQIESDLLSEAVQQENVQAQEPAEPEVAQEPAEPEAAQESAGTEAAQEPAEPEAVQQSAESAEAQAPAEMEAEQQPTEEAQAADLQTVPAAEADTADPETEWAAKAQAADPAEETEAADSTEAGIVAAAIRKQAAGDDAGAGSALGAGGQGITHEQIISSRAWQHKEDIKSLIRQAADQCGLTIDLSDFGLTAMNADGSYTADWEALKEIFWDAADAEYFFLTGNYTCYFDAKDGTISRISLGQSKVNGRNVYGYLSDYRNEDGTPDAEKIRADRQQLADIVSRAVESASAADTDLGKILLLHDFLVTETDYDQEAYLRSIRGEAAVPSIDYTAFGALVNRTAMCNGYALAYSLLMQKLGLQSYIIASDALNHAWNMVVIDDKWYNLDTTRDDSRYMKGSTYYKEENADYTDLGAVSHYYFLYSDAELEEKYGGMYDTYIQCSSQEKPVSYDSAPFSNAYMFRMLSDANFSYEKTNGSWYAFSLKDQSLYRSPTLMMEDAKVVWQNPDARYGAVYKGLLYYNTEEGIYSYDPESGRTRWLLGVNSGEEKISEMVLRGGEITYVVLGEDGSLEKTVPIAQLVGILVEPPQDVPEEKPADVKEEQEKEQTSVKDIAAAEQTSVKDIEAAGQTPARDIEQEADTSAVTAQTPAVKQEPLARDKDAGEEASAAEQDRDELLISFLAFGVSKLGGSYFSR